eukprot:350291_1
MEHFNLVFVICSLLIAITSSQWWSGQSETDCSCSDKAFDVAFDFKSTRTDPQFGYELTCYNYIISRTETYNQHDVCTNQIDFVEMGISVKDCPEIEANGLQHILVDYGASHAMDCDVNIVRDQDRDILGLRYQCDFKPINDVTVYFCVTINNEYKNGKVAYVAANGYDIECDHLDVPNFCGVPPDHAPPPQVYPTPKPVWPTEQPTKWPTYWPSPWPTPQPTNWPTKWPSEWPTTKPTEWPTQWPSQWPSEWPTSKPTDWPTQWPSKWPTQWPTKRPTTWPSQLPTEWPTEKPTEWPTQWPTQWPSQWPTKWPTNWPTEWPTEWPTKWPTQWPTTKPTEWPSQWP